jgi:hypothetical protein
MQLSTDRYSRHPLQQFLIGHSWLHVRVGGWLIFQSRPKLPNFSRGPSEDPSKVYQMAKRKRKEPTAVVPQPKEAVAKKVKLQHDSVSKQKASEVAITKKKPAAIVAEESVKPTAIRIVVGSYEKVLAGIDARFTSSSGDTVRTPSISLIYSINSSLIRFICSRHILAQ